MDINLDIKYLITYSNHFCFENKTFAFRKKELFNITNLPIIQNLKNNNNCLGYWINRKWLSLSKIKQLVKSEEKIVDVSSLQWYQQIHYDLVFNVK